MKKRAQIYLLYRLDFGGFFMYRTLVIEDEAHIRKFICINLKRNDFEAIEAENGAQAIELIKSNDFDIILLDIQLPDISGYEVFTFLKEFSYEIPVIIVSAQGADMDRIMGLEIGADDYVVKPFNPVELVARIRSVLRRTSKNNKRSNILNFKNISIDFKSKKILKNSIEVKLTPKEFEIIYILVKNDNRAIDRNELIDLVWGKNYFGDTKTLDVHIRRLREKIEDDPSKPYFIETVWGVGYRWRKD
jgi:DNA-binding response OmpR family regulator